MTPETILTAMWDQDPSFIIEQLAECGFHICSEGEGVVGGRKVKLEHADVWDPPCVTDEEIAAAEKKSKAAHEAISDDADSDGTWIVWANAVANASRLRELSERTRVYYEDEERPADAVPLYRAISITEETDD